MLPEMGAPAIAARPANPRRHSRASGNPFSNSKMDSRLRGNDVLKESV